VIFRICEATLAGMATGKRADLELALCELNEDAVDAGLAEGAAPITIGRGPQGGPTLRSGDEELPLSRSAFTEVARAYTQAMDQLSRACAAPFGPRNLSRFDGAKARVHRAGATLVQEALAQHHPIDELISRRLFTVVYLIVTGASASQTVRHGPDFGAS